MILRGPRNPRHRAGRGAPARRRFKIVSVIEPAHGEVEELDSVPMACITGNARSNSNGMGPNMGRLTLSPVPTEIRMSLSS